MFNTKFEGDSTHKNPCSQAGFEGFYKKLENIPTMIENDEYR